MPGSCQVCGASLGFFRKLGGQPLCSDCEQRGRKERQEARAAYTNSVQTLTASPSSTALTGFQGASPALLQASGLTEQEQRAVHIQAFRALIDSTLADDSLSEDEEGRLNEVGLALGIGAEVFTSDLADVFPRFIIARANAGRLPVLQQPRMMLKKGEVCYAETEAGLIKEVAVREYHGGSQGVSFRIVKGVRYHVGASRGRFVTVGTRREVADEGELTITSQRAVYRGAKRTIEHQYSKLVGLDVFEDGIAFNVTNRQATTILRLRPGYGEVIAALINAASAESAS
jgi:hypothetical protein